MSEYIIEVIANGYILEYTYLAGIKRRFFETKEELFDFLDQIIEET